MSDMIFKVQRRGGAALIFDRAGTVNLTVPWAEVGRFFGPDESAVFVNGRRTRTGVRLTHRVRDRGW